MSIDERLAGLRAELDEEVAGRVRTPAYGDIVVRHVRRRRTRLATGGAAVVVAAAAVVGGVLATVPGGHPSAVPPAGVSVSSPPATSALPTQSASGTTTAPSGPVTGQTYPAPGTSYVVVPDGSQLVWTDLKTGAHGHFGPADGGQISSPSVSANGRRVAFVEAGGAFAADAQGIAVWDLDSHTMTKVMHGDIATSVAISPDGTQVLWVEHGLVAVVDISAPLSPKTVGLSGEAAAWVGNDAIVYRTDPGGQVGSAGCVFIRLDLSANHVSRCLLPTATLYSIFAPDGSTWQYSLAPSITASSDGGVLAFAVQTNTGFVGIGVVRTSAEATPFRVIPATIATAGVGAPVPVGPPVLIDGGTRVLYRTPTAETRVVSVDLTTGIVNAIPIEVGDGLSQLRQLDIGATSG